MTCVDSGPTLERDAFLSGVGRSLSELYCVALEVPLIEPASDVVDETPFSSEEWAQLYHSLREKIGELDSYWGVSDSTEKEEPIQASLAGDISEIYYDLKENLQLREKVIDQADLLFDVYLSFRDHWGRHAIDALKALYHLRL
jgi:hypothetical protein